MAGWIKLHRKILDNPIFLKPDLYQLFSYCLLRANHNETKIIWNGKEVVLEKGSFITGRKVLALATGQTESAVYKRLDSLRKMGMTTQKSNNKFTIVKVLNYSVYQGEEIDGEQPSNNKVTTKEQQGNTDNTLKNLKNEKKGIKSINTLVGFDFESVWKLYPKKEGKGQISKTQMEKLAKIGVEELSRAVERYRQSKQGTDRQYLQNGSTFFNSGYVDYLDANYQAPEPNHNTPLSMLKKLYEEELANEQSGNDQNYSDDESGIS